MERPVKHPVLCATAVVETPKGIVYVCRKGRPFEDFWSLPGGIVNYKEKLVDAVKREVREELGIGVSVSKLLDVKEEFLSPADTKYNHRVVVFFLCKPVGSFDLKKHVKEVRCAKISKEIPHPILPSHKEVLMQVLLK